MMKKRGIDWILIAMMTIACWAAFASVKLDGSIEPVAAAFPDWRGVDERGYLMGRKIVPSDLRHKVTVVVVLNSKERLREQVECIVKRLAEIPEVTVLADASRRSGTGQSRGQNSRMWVMRTGPLQN